VAERVIDVLEIICIEECHRDMSVRGAGLDRIRDQGGDPRPVGQPGQRIVIGHPGDLGAVLLALDRQRAEMNAGLDNALVPAAWRAAFPEIEGKGADHPAIPGLDRRGPAGAQADLEGAGLVRRPARIGVEVDRECGLAVIGRAAARADLGADRDALQRP